uniref:Ig-like domain-containing protein n=2 Tax=Astatotilapia calliptera TaxID=8154 RepID=A0AAX7SXR8_ASTCA
MAVQSRWIKMAVPFILILQFTGALSGDLLLSFTVRDGDNVTLPCKNVINNHHNCDTTTWLFTDSRSTPSVELINLGQIKEKAKSDRLSVRAECSLVIKKVTAEDVGRYTCRQFRGNPGKQQGPDAVVYLSVVSMTEHKKADEVTLNCSVWTYERCKHKVKWIHISEALDRDYSNLKTSESSCSAAVTFLNDAYSHISTCDFNCSVTTEDNKEQLFTFSTQSSGKEAVTAKSATTTSATITSATTTSATTTSATTLYAPSIPGADQVWPYILVVVILVAVLIVAVKLICLKRLKGNKIEANGNAGLTSNPAVTKCAPETSQETVDPEDGVSYASITYANKTHNKNKIRGKNDSDEGETVTYATVKASSTDASSLYATIK